MIAFILVVFALVALGVMNRKCIIGDGEFAVAVILMLNLQSKCNKKRSTHQLEYNFVSTQK
ncbi:hypothetical protein, partial [Escherichia coli]|uniref:hypothetical protein n=1 Tax=Escherichia coli TaxID=562 RepID=UPI003CF8F835